MKKVLVTGSCTLAKLQWRRTLVQQIAVELFYLHPFFNLLISPLPSVRQRNRNATAFASLKKFAPHFFNHAPGVTEPKDVANPVTGFNYKE